MQPNHTLMLGELEKAANPFLRQMFMSGMRQAGGLAGKAMRTPLAKTVTDKARSMANSGFGKGVRGMADDATKAVTQKATDFATSATPYVKPPATMLGQFGQGITTGTRKLLNKADDAVQYAMSGPGGVKGVGFSRWGDDLVGKTDVNPLSVRNLGVGAGGAAGVYEGGKALAGGMFGGGSAAGAADPVTQSVVNQTSTGGGGAGGGFLSGMPREMQYALAAGVPLALLGAYMGGRGNMMGGLGLGALGLGAAGLGAAGAGYLGDDARRFVGQGANSLMGLFGAGKDGDVMGQIQSLSRLSPEFGVTMLMGKNPGLSREEAQKMYEFLTQNQDSISKMLPAVTGAQTPAVKAGAAFAKSAGRCWSGYEPVPGKAPYSEGSCRPTGSKKKKKEKKAFLNPAMKQMLGKAMPGMKMPQMPNMKMPQMPTQQPSPHERTLIGINVGPKPNLGAGPINPNAKQPEIHARTMNPYDMKVAAQNKEAFGGALLGMGARMAGKGIANAVTKGIPALSRGAVQGAGKLTSMIGGGAQAAGKMVGNAGQQVGRLGEHVMSHAGQTAVSTARNPLERFTADAVGTLGGAAGMTGNVMQGLGGVANMAGRGANMLGQGLQQAGKHTAAALPLTAAGAYGAYQAARPLMPNVQFRNPIADAGGVQVRPMRFQNPVVVN